MTNASFTEQLAGVGLAGRRGMRGDIGESCSSKLATVPWAERPPSHWPIREERGAEAFRLAVTCGQYA